MPDYPINHGGRENGGNRRFLEGIESGLLCQRWTWTPDLEWSCKILARDFFGPHAAQGGTITIPAAGFASGRLTATFTGYGLSSPVSVIADAVEGDANTDLAVTLEANIATARAGSLIAVLSGESVATNVVTWACIIGTPQGTVTVSWDSAQSDRLVWDGTDLVDGDYTITYSGAGLGAPVVVTVSRVLGVPATTTTLATQAETDIEAEGGLAAAVQSADASTNTNTVLFFPGLAPGVMATVVPPHPQAWDSVFGGTPTDGNYVHTFAHVSLPADVPVTTTRAVGVPATNILLAAQAETDIEADPQIAHLIATATDDGAGVNEIRTWAGVTGLTVTAAAPAPGTLVPTDVTDGPTLTVVPNTPAGPTVVVNHTVSVLTNDIAKYGRFPENSFRLEVAIDVVTAFGAGRTMTFGHTMDPDALLGSTPIDINTVARSGYVAADAEFIPRYEAAMVTLAVFSLGTSGAATAGSCTVQISYCPNPTA